MLKNNKAYIAYIFILICEESTECNRYIFYISNNFNINAT